MPFGNMLHPQTPRAADGFTFGYKDMDESMGPCEAGCPERILRLLTPTTNEHALNWRRRCQENVQLRTRPIINDMRIKLPAPMAFTDGYVADEFIVMKSGAKVTLSKIDNYGRYRIRNFRTIAWAPVTTTKVHRTAFASASS